MAKASEEELLLVIDGLNEIIGGQQPVQLRLAKAWWLFLAGELNRCPERIIH